MSSMVLKIGPSEPTEIDFRWFDENGVRLSTKVRIDILDSGHLQVWVNRQAPIVIHPHSADKVTREQLIDEVSNSVTDAVEIDLLREEVARLKFHLQIYQQVTSLVSAGLAEIGK